MFTGIVSEKGTVAAIEPIDQGARLTITAKETTSGLASGDSVAVNGTCLTATTIQEDRFGVDAVAETLARTTLGALRPGDAVNLERPMPADGRFDGHIVQGHVDGVGEVVSLTPEGASTRMRVRMPSNLAHYVVEKGSIAMHGVSLTVTETGDSGGGERWFEVALIPHTLDVTVLGELTQGDPVNLEVDVLAKYVERLMGDRS